MVINGLVRDLRPGSLADVLAQLGVRPQGIAVELDGAIVPLQDLAATPVSAESRVELIHFVGGG